LLLKRLALEKNWNIFYHFKKMLNLRRTV